MLAAAHERSYPCRSSRISRRVCPVLLYSVSQFRVNSRSLPMRSSRRSMPIACEPRGSQGGPHCHLIGGEHGLFELPLDFGKDIEGAKVCAAEEHGVGLGPVGGDRQITNRFVANPENVAGQPEVSV